MVKRGINALYVTYSGLPVGPNSGVIRSQVYDLLKGISENCPIQICIRLVCFVQKEKFKRNIVEFKKLISDISNLNINIKIVTILTRRCLYKFLKGTLFLLKEYLQFLPDIIHVRSYEPTFFALMIKFIFGHRVKVICDLRGVYPEENKQICGWKQRSLKYRLQIFTNAADIGLLAREESIINRVAFPIKVLNYLASGLPVITTKANLFISQILEKEKLGLVFESQDNDFPQKLDGSLDTETKIRCINFAKNHNVAEISKKYLDIYFKTVGYYD